MRRSAPLLARVLCVPALAAALAMAHVPAPSARPYPSSLREGIDPVTGRRVARPTPAFPTWDRPARFTPQQAVVPNGPDGQPEWPDASYPERVLEEIAFHNANLEANLVVLPTTQSYDRDDIAVIEDDGTILRPTGSNVRIDSAALVRRFLAIHNDEYDYICVFAASNITNLTLGGGFAYELNVKNDVFGLGLMQFDYTLDYGSSGALYSFLNMNRLSRYPADPNQTGVVATNSGLDVLAQESGHRFAAYTFFQDGDTASSAILGRDDQHWGFFFNSLASEMEGNQWRDNGNGTFTTVDATSRYNFLDEYLFGLRDSSEVDTLWYVANPTAFNPPNAYVRQSPPEIGVTATGTKRYVDISQITAANGLRSPGKATSPKTFRMGFVLLVRNGEVPTTADLAKIDLYRTSWATLYASAVHGLATMDTHMTPVAGTVAIEHTPFKDTENTTSSRLVTASMYIKQKSRLIGFEDSSPRLFYRINGGPSAIKSMPPTGGFTFGASIPAQPANTSVDYYLTGASDSVGIEGMLPADGTTNPFHYQVGPDVTAPTLAHVSPPPDPAVSQLPIQVKVAAFDNLGLDSVGVEWRKTNGPLQTQSVAVTGDGNYAFAIGAGAGFGDAITYRFIAVDKAAAKNRARIPETGAWFAFLVGNNFAESFENSDGGFLHGPITSGYDGWHTSTQRNHTAGGSSSWKCGADGPGGYASRLDAGLLTPQFTIGTNARMRFWHFYDTETGDIPGQVYDGGLIEISTNNGGTWSAITPVGGYPARIIPNPSIDLPGGTPVYGGASGGFVQGELDLSGYAGKTLRVRWRFCSDAYVAREGWYVDDVTVTNDAGVPVAVPVLPSAAFALGPPVPNPSAAHASIAFHLPMTQAVRLALYDVRGRLVRTLIDGPRAAGPYAADWDGRLDDGRTAPAGLYFYRLTGTLSGSREGRLVRTR